jgi:putative glutamine amidotransferase
MYEIDLLQEFVGAGKPVLGICRGLQLINVAFGGTLYQDIDVQRGTARVHHNPDAYDQNFHRIAFLPGSGLAKLYPGVGSARVNSIHHQAVKTLGKDLTAEAESVPDGVVEAIRWIGPSFVVGVQWHPEFHDPANPDLLDGNQLLLSFLEQAEKVRGRRGAGLPASPVAERE